MSDQKQIAITTQKNKWAEDMFAKKKILLKEKRDKDPMMKKLVDEQTKNDRELSLITSMKLLEEDKHKRYEQAKIAGNKVEMTKLWASKSTINLDKLKKDFQELTDKEAEIKKNIENRTKELLQLRADEDALIAYKRRRASKYKENLGKIPGITSAELEKAYKDVMPGYPNFASPNAATGGRKSRRRRRRRRSRKKGRKSRKSRRRNKRKSRKRRTRRKSRRRR